MVGFGFLSKILGTWLGPTYVFLLFCECRWDSDSIRRWWGHLNTTSCNQTYLNFLHSEVVGTQKPSFHLPSHPHVLCTSCPHTLPTLCLLTLMPFHPCTLPHLCLLALVPSNPCTLWNSYLCTLSPLCPHEPLQGHEGTRIWRVKGQKGKMKNNPEMFCP